MVTTMFDGKEAAVLRYVCDCASEAIDKMKTYRDTATDDDREFLKLLDELQYHMQSAKILANLRM